MKITRSKMQKIYGKGKLPGVSVGMKKIELDKGAIILYDTSGPYIDSQQLVKSKVITPRHNLRKTK